MQKKREKVKLRIWERINTGFIISITLPEYSYLQNTHTHTRTHNPRVSSEKLVNSMERFINFLILKNEELALAGIAQWFE